MAAALVIVCGLLGVAVGACSIVVTERVPKKEPLRPWSWPGRSTLGPKHVAVVAGTSAVFCVTAARFADSWGLPAYLVLAAALVALTVIDIEHYLLPNRIIYPTGFATAPLLVVGAIADGEPRRIAWALIGGAGAFAVFYILHFLRPSGMAFGDVRLSFLLGMHLGWIRPAHVFIGLFLAFVLASTIGLALVAIKGRSLRSRIPFGPFMAIGAQIAILVGNPIADAWLGS